MIEAIARAGRQPLAFAVVATATTLCLSGCGSRLPLATVLAQNAAVYANGHSTGPAEQQLAPGLGPGGSQTAITGSTAGQSQSGSGGTAAPSPTASAVGATGSSGNASASAGSPVGGASAAQPSGQSATTPHGAAGPATGTVVNVGQIGTDSGVLGLILGQARTGAEIWAKWINQHGGLNGHKVNLITADDGGDPSKGLSEAQTMVTQDHVIAFMGSANALSEATVANYLNKVHVPSIAGDNVTVSWFQNPMYFGTGGSLRIEMGAILKQSVANHIPRVGIAYCVELALVCGAADNIVKADAASLGAQFVWSASISLAQPDFTPQCLSAKSAGVQTLILAMDPQSVVRFVSDCHNQGFHPQYVTTMLSFTAALQTPELAGILGFGPSFPYILQTPATATFDQAVESATGGPPDSEWYAEAWVAGLVLSTASADLPASNPTPADVLAGLYRIRNDDFGGLAPPLSYYQGEASTASPLCNYELQVDASGHVVAPIGMAQVCLPAAYQSVTP